MPEISRLLDQLRRAFDGNAWSGPSLWATLDGLSARQAAARPVASAHSIWELVLHVTAWLNLVAQRVASRQNLAMPPDQDWPPQPDLPTEAIWQNTLAGLQAAHAQVLAVAEALQEADLDQVLAPGSDPETEASVYVLLHGLVQHNLYHAGQVALLRKAVAG